MSKRAIQQVGPKREPAPGYDVIRADCLFVGAILIDTILERTDTVTSVQVTRSGYVLITTELHPNIPRMSRGETLWRILP